MRFSYDSQKQGEKLEDETGEAPVGVAERIWGGLWTVVDKVRMAATTATCVDIEQHSSPLRR
jgi:hypothetical protein